MPTTTVPDQPILFGLFCRTMTDIYALCSKFEPTIVYQEGYLQTNYPVSNLTAAQEEQADQQGWDEDANGNLRYFVGH